LAGTPLVEPAGDGRFVLTFLWRGAERNVRLFGGPSAEHDDLQRLGATDVWYKSYTVPASTRLSYQLAPDVPKGRIDSFRFASALLGNERKVSIYTPPGGPAQAMVVLFDGTAYQTKVPTPTILDNLIAEKRIPPTMAVFIDNPDIATRGRELPPNPVFADVLAGDLMDEVRRRTSVAVPAARTILAGSSFGGLASAYVASRHPQVFGGVLSQSGSFWWHPQDGDPTQPVYMARVLLEKPVTPIRFYLEAGLFETGRAQATILDTSHHLRDVLQAKGYEVTYREHAAGHDYASWRGTLADGLVALLGPAAGR